MYIQRNIEKEILKFMGMKEYIAVVWSRQVGKTTFLKFLKNKYKDCFLYNFEDLTIRNDFQKSAVDFVKSHIKNWKRVILLFDEYQYVENAWSLLKLVYDTFDDTSNNKVKIIISWSSTLDLKEIWAKMVGRLFEFQMVWLTTGEVLKSQNKPYYHSFQEASNIIYDQLENMELSDEKIEYLSKLPFQNKIMEIVDDIIVWWWLPAVILNNDRELRKEILSNFIQNYINKDIISLMKVRKIDEYSNLMIFLSVMIWKQLVHENVSNDIGVSLHILKEYLNYLSHTFIIDLISPYSKNYINEIKKQKKQNFYDLWLRNYLIRGYNTKKRSIYE